MKKISFKKVKGFTLIELMVAVTIVAIISVSALPIFVDKIIRDQVKEGLSLAESVKEVVYTYTNANEQTFPLDNEEANFPGLTGEFVSSVEIVEGDIIATFGNRANLTIKNQTLTLTPTTTIGTYISWTCSFSGDVKYAPYICKNITP